MGKDFFSLSSLTRSVIQATKSSLHFENNPVTGKSPNRAVAAAGSNDGPTFTEVVLKMHVHKLCWERL